MSHLLLFHDVTFAYVAIKVEMGCLMQSSNKSDYLRLNPKIPGFIQKLGAVFLNLKTKKEIKN